MAKWEELPIADRAAYMRVAVKNGYKDIRSIREAYNKYGDGGDKSNKVGPTYNPETRTWTGPKGHNITNKSFKGKWGTTTYLESGAVDLDLGNNKHQYRHAPNAKRVYIGGSPNEARQKYFDMDTELTNNVKQVAKQYGINPEVLASRMAKEGPIDENIKHYNNTNGYYGRGNLMGPIWGLDDMGTMITQGLVQKPASIDDLFTDVEMENEKGRITYSVESDDFMDGVPLTAAALVYFKNEMKKRFPSASAEQLDQYATAAFNMGVTGATKLIKGKGLQGAYKPFIKIK